jgi:hypothetical protein
MVKKIHILLDCSAVFSHDCVVVIGGCFARLGLQQQQKN